jgi:hypothetical protein
MGLSFMNISGLSSSVPFTHSMLYYYKLQRILVILASHRPYGKHGLCFVWRHRACASCTDTKKTLPTLWAACVLRALPSSGFTSHNMNNNKTEFSWPKLVITVRDLHIFIFPGPLVIVNLSLDVKFFMGIDRKHTYTLCVKYLQVSGNMATVWYLEALSRRFWRRESWGLKFFTKIK